MSPARAMPSGVLALSLFLGACAGDEGREARDEAVDEAIEGAGGEAATTSGDVNPLLDPTSEAMNQTAPDVYFAKFETNKGDFVVEVRREWAPNGADRFYNLVENGFYDGVRFFRVLDGFVAQFGISGDPQVSSIWRQRAIPDDPVQASNTRGYVTYASGGPNTRTTQIFINFGNNSMLDDRGFPPFGMVVSGMEVVDSLYSDYGEGAPRGTGPSQARLQAEGNAYLEAEFPQLDFVERATVVEGAEGS